MSILSDESELMDDIPYKAYRVDERLIKLESNFISCSEDINNLKFSTDDKLQELSRKLNILQVQIYDLIEAFKKIEYSSSTNI